MNRYWQAYIIDPNGKIALSHKGLKESDLHHLRQTIKTVMGNQE